LGTIRTIEGWYKLLEILPTDWPEFFEEVKKPTEDGFKIFKGDKVFVVYLDCTYPIEPYTISFILNANDYDGTNPHYKYFSKRENAEKWVKENKPKFSEKQIREAISISHERTLATTPNTQYYTDYRNINTDRFKKELGL
jgi:hypothetical protein